MVRLPGIVAGLEGALRQGFFLVVAMISSQVGTLYATHTRDLPRPTVLSYAMPVRHRAAYLLWTFSGVLPAWQCVHQEGKHETMRNANSQWPRMRCSHRLSLTGVHQMLRWDHEDAA